MGITLKDLAKILEEKYKNREQICSEISEIEEIKNYNTDNARKPVIYKDIYKMGQDMYTCHCYNCGNNFEIDRNIFWKKCPKCENREFDCSSIVKPRINNKFIYTLDFNLENEYIIFISFSIYFLKVNESKIKFETDYKPRAQYEGLGLFSSKFGFRFFSPKLMTGLSNPSNEHNYNHSFVSSEFLVNDKLKKMCKLLKIENMNNIKASLLKKNEEIKNTNKRIVKRKPKTTVAEKLNEYKDIDTTLFIDKLKKSHTLFYEETDDSYKYKTICNCGHIFNHSKKINEVGRYSNIQNTICPSCKKQINGNIVRGNKTYSMSYFMLFENDENIDNFVVRIFKYCEEFSLNNTIERKINEHARVIFHTNHRHTIKNFYIKKDDAWIKTGGTNVDGDLSAVRNLTSQEKMKEVINNCSLKFSGILEAYGLVESNLKVIGNIEYPFKEDEYFKVYLSNNYIEQIYKCQLYNILDDILQHNYNISINAYSGDIYSILGISKSVYKIARKRNFDSKSLNNLKMLWKIDNNITEEIYDKLNEFGIHFTSYSKMETLKNEYKISLTRQLDYLKNCHDFQCIEYNEILTIWADYLKIASKLKYNLSNKNKKFPSSLKKEHDIAVFTYNQLKKEIDIENFKESAIANAKYEYSSDEYIIKIPQMAEEIVSEGKELNHCVATYVERVKDGKTCICFLREKASPETSLYTIEVIQGCIKQVRGMCNKLPDDDKVIDFIKTWANKKSLEIICDI